VATNVRTARDNLGLFDTIVLGDTSDFLRLTQGLATVDGATGELRLTQTIATVDGVFGLRRVSQAFLQADMTAGLRRISNVFAGADMAAGTRRVSQVLLSVDIASWYLRPVDTLPLYDTVVSTKIVGVEIPIEGTTYTRVATDGLDVFDPHLRGITRSFVETQPVTDWAQEWENEQRVRRVTDTLRLWDRTQAQRHRSRDAHDYLTVADSCGFPVNHYAALGLVELLGRGDGWYNPHCDGLGLIEVSGWSEDTWRSFSVDGLGVVDLLSDARYRKVELAVTGLPDGYSAQVIQPDNTVVAQAVASMGAVTLEMDVPFLLTSGTLEIFRDGAAYTLAAPFGVIPISGYADLKRTNIWHYTPAPYALGTTMTSAYIERPWGGWTAPGSARVDREEIGYTTFTDSALSGLARGSNGTTVAVHGAGPPSVVCVVKSGRGTLNITSYLSSTNSVRWLQDSIPIFVNSSDELLIGASSKFSAVHFSLARNATERVMLTPYYSIGQGTWASWTSSAILPVLDTTSGFTWSGYAGIEPPGNWAPSMRYAAGSATLVDSVPRYWFRLVRKTGSGALVPPRLMGVTLTGDAVITQRYAQPLLYYPTLQDSGQVLYFKAIARGIGGGVGDGASAPVTVVNLGV